MAFQTFQFSPSGQNEYPLQDMIGKLLGGYSQASQAKFLQPNMREDLLKKQQYNQYYGRDKESQIGLRNSQRKNVDIRNEYLPKSLQEALIKDRLYNKNYQSNNDLAQALKAAQIGNYGAMTNEKNIRNKYLPHSLENEEAMNEFKLNNPLLGMTGTAGQVGSLLYMQQHPELSQQQNQIQSMPLGENESYINPISQQSNNNQNSLNPQQLLHQAIINSLNPKKREFAPSNIGKLQQELKEIEEGFYPNTGKQVPFASEQEKEDAAAPYREKLGALQSGSHYMYDPKTHEKIGVERPYTAKEKEVEIGRHFFNEVYPDINNGFKDFIGKDSVNNFLKYANEYGKNEVATKKIDDLLYAQKLISAGVVNEASTLGAGKTNQTYRNLLKSFPGTDLPNLIERYGKELKIPSEAFIKAGVRFSQKINDASNRANNAIPQLKKTYYKPEEHVKSSGESSNESRSNNKAAPNEAYNDSDIDFTAKKYGISRDEVISRLKGKK